MACGIHRESTHALLSSVSNSNRMRHDGERRPAAPSFLYASVHHRFDQEESGKIWPDLAIVGLGDNKMTRTESDGEILTLEEVAAFLKAGKRTVYRFAQNGEIPAFKLGGTWRFRRSELESWIRANSNQRKPDGNKGER